MNRAMNPVANSVTAMRCVFLITCEHGGKRIPAGYRDCFKEQATRLQSHHGYDAGALRLARDMAQHLNAPLIYSTTSRLLVDLNRSRRHPRLHAPAIRQLPAARRQQILERHYLPFRAQAQSVIADAIASGRQVIHISSHSFTPLLEGQVRNADIGLLYDPSRSAELALCRHWQARLRARQAGLRVRRNYPYRGISDGFTAYLRRCFAADHYIGIELEINQSIVHAGGKTWRALRATLIDTLIEAVAATAAATPNGRPPAG